MKFKTIEAVVISRIHPEKMKNLRRTKIVQVNQQECLPALCRANSDSVIVFLLIA